jgi:hypothetical protein
MERSLALASTEAEGARPAVLTGNRPVQMFIPRGIEIRTERLLRIMGYRDETKIRPAVLRNAGAVAEVAMQAISPTVHFRRAQITGRKAGVVEIDGDVTLTSEAFDKYLAACGEVVAFVLTLGRRFDQVEKNLVSTERMLEAVFLETAGWLAIEEGTRLFTQALTQQVEPEGLALSRRLAPGYSFRLGNGKVDWRLEDQKPLFELLKSASLPVELLDSCAMNPKMSRTGLFGLRPAARSRAADIQH